MQVFNGEKEVGGGLFELISLEKENWSKYQSKNRAYYLFQDISKRWTIGSSIDGTRFLYQTKHTCISECPHECPPTWRNTQGGLSSLTITCKVYYGYLEMSRAKFCQGKHRMAAYSVNEGINECNKDSLCKGIQDWNGMNRNFYKCTGFAPFNPNAGPVYVKKKVFDGYLEKSNKMWCEDLSESRIHKFIDVETAIQDCNSKEDCRGVKDINCDGSHIIQCKTTTTLKTASEGCTYVRICTAKANKMCLFP